jgi:hypothetical protein
VITVHWTNWTRVTHGTVDLPGVPGVDEEILTSEGPITIRKVVWDVRTQSVHVSGWAS